MKRSNVRRGADMRGPTVSSSDYGNVQQRLPPSLLACRDSRNCGRHDSGRRRSRTRATAPNNRSRSANPVEPPQPPREPILGYRGGGNRSDSCALQRSIPGTARRECWFSDRARTFSVRYDECRLRFVRVPVGRAIRSLRSQAHACDRLPGFNSRGHRARDRAWNLGCHDRCLSLGTAHGLTQGLLAALVADAAPNDLRGTAFGFFNFASGIALLLASLIAGALWQVIGPSATFVAGATFMVIGLLGSGIIHWSRNENH